MKKIAALLLLLVEMACDEDKAPPEISVDINVAFVGTFVARPDAGPIDFDLHFYN